MSYEFDYERQNQFIPTNFCSVYHYHLIQFEQECFVFSLQLFKQMVTR